MYNVPEGGSFVLGGGGMSVPGGGGGLVPEILKEKRKRNRT